MSDNYDYPPASNPTSRGLSPRPPISTSSRTSQTRFRNLRDLIMSNSERNPARSREETTRALRALRDLEHLQLQQQARQRAMREPVSNSQTPQTSTESSRPTTDHVPSANPYSEQGSVSALVASTTNSSLDQDFEALVSEVRSGRRGMRPSAATYSLPASVPHRLIPADESETSVSHRVRSATLASIREGFNRLNSSLGLSNDGEFEPWLSVSSDLDSTHRQSVPASSSRPGSRGRYKRRKLESDDNKEDLVGSGYGYQGQVVPGLLKMEINKCDGGNYYDEVIGETSWPGNVLLDDTSVYCTKKSHCNMILNHHGETPFSLKKITIRAPKKGFDAAIQEGMVFVSMSSDELLERTAEYQIQYSSPDRRDHESRRQYLNPSREYFNTYRPSRRRFRHVDIVDHYSPTVGDSETQPNISRWSSRRSFMNPTYAEPQFRITTQYDNNAEGDSNEDLGNDADPWDSEDESELFCPAEEDDASDDGGLSETNSRNPIESGRRAALNRSNFYGMGSNRRLTFPSIIEPVRPSAGTSSTGLDADGTETPEIMKPHARFFIEREKSMVSINFDPPVSGRYILIKLWSPYNGGNIDIESIMVHGFAGTRFFPALEMR